MPQRRTPADLAFQNPDQTMPLRLRIVLPKNRPARPYFRITGPTRQIAPKLVRVYSSCMKAEFTAVIEPAEEGGFWATCPEVPGANGQGETVEEAKASLADAIRLILEDRREDALRGVPSDAIQDVVAVQ
jgi:predicted RNase H-like HicB family nuclease